MIIYNVLAYAPGVGSKWVHPSNLRCNGSGGYVEALQSETPDKATFVAIRWIDTNRQTVRRRR